MAEICEVVRIKDTPALLAEMFWEMSNREQARFFATLEQLAGIRLCSQMSYVTDAIMELADAGFPDALNGFQTMLAHSQGYVEDATARRVWRAKYEIAGEVRKAKLANGWALHD